MSKLAVDKVVSPSPSKLKLAVPSVSVKLSLAVHINCMVSKFNSVDEELPILIALAPSVPTLIFWSTLSVPIPIVLCESIVNAPDASISKLVVDKVVAPLPSKLKFAEPSVSVKLSLAVHINCIVSKFNSVDEELPILIVLSPSVPIFIFWSTSSVPIPINPDAEFKVKLSSDDKVMSDAVKLIDVV